MGDGGLTTTGGFRGVLDGQAALIGPGGFGMGEDSRQAGGGLCCGSGFSRPGPAAGRRADSRRGREAGRGAKTALAWARLFLGRAYFSFW